MEYNCANETTKDKSSTLLRFPTNNDNTSDRMFPPAKLECKYNTSGVICYSSMGELPNLKSTDGVFNPRLLQCTCQRVKLFLPQRMLFNTLLFILIAGTTSLQATMIQQLPMLAITVTRMSTFLFVSSSFVFVTFS